MHISTTTTRRSGFTLIELSIVLVIIGLIVGGVLVGQDLIKAAEIRATVGQVEKYNAAINTFRTKYNGIPGDIASSATAGVTSQASAFGLCPTAGCMAGTTGLGDGNGLVEPTTVNLQIGETLAFWQHLSVAGLVDGNFGSALTNGGAVASDTSTSTVSSYVPPAKLGRGNHWTVAASSGQNYYVLGAFSGTPIAVAGTTTFAKGLTPIESYNIDVKLDDGSPNTGVVQARDAVASAFANFVADTTTPAATHTITATSQACQTTGANATATSNTYKRDATSGTTPNCMLRFRFN